MGRWLMRWTGRGDIYKYSFCPGTEATAQPHHTGEPRPALILSDSQVSLLLRTDDLIRFLSSVPEPDQLVLDRLVPGPAGSGLSGSWTGWFWTSWFWTGWFLDRLVLDLLPAPPAPLLQVLVVPPAAGRSCSSRKPPGGRSLLLSFQLQLQRQKVFNLLHFFFKFGNKERKNKSVKGENLMF